MEPLFRRLPHFSSAGLLKLQRDMESVQESLLQEWICESLIWFLALFQQSPLFKLKRKEKFPVAGAKEEKKESLAITWDNLWSLLFCGRRKFFEMTQNEYLSDRHDRTVCEIVSPAPGSSENQHFCEAFVMFPVRDIRI